MVNEPDPRIARTKQKVRAATLELLAEHGMSGLTIERVAARSGVAKSSIYRYWPNLPPLVLDAFQTVSPPAPARPDTGDVRADTAGFLAELADTITTAPAASLMAALVDGAERDPRLRELLGTLIERRRAPLRDILADGLARGQLPPGTDPGVLAGVLGGTLFYRRLISHEPIDAAFVAHLLDHLLPSDTDRH